MKLTVHPLKTKTFTPVLTQGYGKAKTVWLRLLYRAFGGYHPGLDWGGRGITARPIFHAADKGRVTFAGKDGGWGICVRVRCEITSKGVIHLIYAHLSAVDKGILVGQLVKPKQVIGYVGNTGSSTAPHLHFGYGDTSLPGVGKDHWVDPTPYFEQGGITP